MHGCVNELHLLDSTTSVLDVVRQEVEVREESFFVVDLGKIVTRFEQWCGIVPRVQPLYNVTDSSSSAVLKTLAALGSQFVCQRKTDIKLVSAIGAEAVVIGGPCKLRSVLNQCSSLATTVIVDSTEEVEKVGSSCLDAELMINVLSGNSEDFVGFSDGASLVAITNILRLAKQLKLQVTGLSFNIDPDCVEIESYVEALSQCSVVRNIVEQAGFKLTKLNIGRIKPCSDEFLDQLSAAVEEYFPDVEITADITDYLTSSTFSLVTQVLAVRKSPDGVSYYLNDGVYGSFSTVLIGGTVNPPSILPECEGKTRISKLLGPTCDPSDLICSDIHLPLLCKGDSLIFSNMSVAKSMRKPAEVFVSSQENYIQLQDIISDRHTEVLDDSWDSFLLDIDI